MRKENLLFETPAFLENPDTGFIYQNNSIKEGLARLNCFIKSGNFMIILGQTGVGKSVLLKLFLNSISKEKCKTVYFNLTSCKTGGIWRLLYSKITGNYAIGIYKDRIMSDIINKINYDNIPVVIVIDEAHLLSDSSLIDIRLLASSPDNLSNIKIVLSGQEELKNTLRKDVHSALLSRIAFNYTIKHLSESETISYIDYQIKSANLPDKLFDDDAKAKIFSYSDGIPRTINNIARASYLTALSQNISIVSADIVENAFDELSF